MTTATKSKKTGKRTGPARPAMTAEEAQRFEGYSVGNMAMVLEARDGRAAEGVHADCACEPYEDFFTYGRWAAQGFQVRKGEKGIRLSTWIEAKGKKADEGEAATAPASDAGSQEEASGAEGDRKGRRLIPWTTTVFCRCQVDRKETSNGRR